MDYHNSDGREEAGQQTTFEEYRRMVVSRISSDIPNRTVCLDTSIVDFIVLSHAIAGHIQLY